TTTHSTCLLSSPTHHRALHRSLHDALPIFTVAVARSRSVAPSAPRRTLRRPPASIAPITSQASPRARNASRHSPAREGSAQSRRSEEHTSELQSLRHLVCRLLLEKKK